MLNSWELNLPKFSKKWDCEFPSLSETFPKPGWREAICRNNSAWSQAPGPNNLPDHLIEVREGIRLGKALRVESTATQEIIFSRASDGPPGPHDAACPQSQGRKTGPFRALKQTQNHKGEMASELSRKVHLCQGSVLLLKPPWPFPTSPQMLV